MVCLLLGFPKLWTNSDINNHYYIKWSRRLGATCVFLRLFVSASVASFGQLFEKPQWRQWLFFSHWMTPHPLHAPGPDQRALLRATRTSFLLETLAGDDLYRITSSTAQGGGGSFKKGKPIGEVGCCEIKDGRAKPLMDWKLLDLTHSFSLFLCLSTYLPIYLCIYLSIYPSIYLSICLSVCLSICLAIYLSIYLI